MKLKEGLVTELPPETYWIARDLIDAGGRYTVWASKPTLTKVLEDCDGADYWPGEWKGQKPEDLVFCVGDENHQLENLDAFHDAKRMLDYGMMVRFEVLRVVDMVAVSRSKVYG